jgi:hypothetical protein
MMNAGMAIAEPVARLRLAKKITILLKNSTVAVLPVDFTKVRV